MEQIKNLSLIMPVIISLPFLIIALVFVALALRTRRKASGARNWNTTDGRILSSYVERRRRVSGTGSTSSLYPVIAYEYHVDGQRYQGHRINFGSEVGSSFASMTQGVVDKYPPGSAVSVHYNPEIPTQAVLEKTAGVSTKIFLLVAVFIVALLVCTLGATFGMMSFFTDKMDSLLPR